MALLALGTAYTDRIEVYRNGSEALDGTGWRMVLSIARDIRAAHAVHDVAAGRW